jgi:hypothetical protein
MSDALKDLAIVPVTSSDTNYFLRKVTGLKIDKIYSFKFQWVLEDGTLSEWSPGYQISTPTESVPAAPSVSVPTTNASHIPVTLPVFPANIKRVDVYIIGGVYGTGKVADSFLQAGTKTIAADAGEYQVSLISVSPSGINGSPTNTFNITVTDPTANIQSPEDSVAPSAPTVSSVLGAIQVAWNGKTSTGGNQPYGFNSAKVYVGTSSGFTPSSLNQVDVLNFANGQNTLNIGVGTIVDGVALAHGVDYYIKIATTNGTDTSTAVSATGNPVRVGQVQNGSIVAVTADKIDSGTVAAGSTITVGSTLGKHVKLSGTGDPLTIYGSGGVSNPVLSYNGNKLTIVGDGTFSGNLSAAGGTFSGNISGASGTFGGALDVGTTLLATITGASSVNVNGITRVRFIAENALNANDSVNISGIAPNQVFAYWANPPTNTIPIYNYPANPFNLGTVTVYEAGPTYFDIQSGVTGTYTSGGTATGSAFRVSSTGLVRGAAGQIGGWVIDVTKLRSASGSISLDPITPQITIKGSGGYTGYNITLASPTGITAGSTFSVTPAGYLTSTNGSIAGWNINGSSISKSVPYTDVFDTVGTLTTTLGSNAKITVASTNGPFGYFNLGIDSAIIAENATQKFEIGPNGIGFVNKALNLGVQSGYMRMWTSSGDRGFNIYWDGWRTDPDAYEGATPENYAPFQWKWINYSTAAERLTHIASITYDTSPQSLRPLVIDGDGSQYLGATSYFSTTQTTTPSAGTGSNGDLYYSTA